MKNRLLLPVLVLFLIKGINAQERFELKNPSFEKDKPAAAIVPEGWLNMGAPGETPPDIQPGFFDVYLKAQDGKTYLGLARRDNNTWEGVGQRLEGFLKKEFNEKADVYVINTCSVTENADKECRLLVRRIQRKAPESLVVVTGCYAHGRCRLGLNAFIICRGFRRVRDSFRILGLLIFSSGLLTLRLIQGSDHTICFFA